MNLNQAIKAIFSGKKVALPEWGGYWYLGDDGTIMVHTAAGEDFNTPYFDKYLNREDWQVIQESEPTKKSNVTVTQEMVDENMKDVIVRTLNDFGKPCTYVTVRMKNGFTLRESTTCVDPRNYSEELGKKICLEKIEDKVWFLLGYDLQTEASAKNKVLASTRNMMLSPDYKERFRAEYIQLVNRIVGLKRMLENWDAGKLNFKPTCPRELYDVQVEGMEKYLAVLRKRAQIENVAVD